MKTFSLVSLSKRPVAVRLNTGATRHLAPGTVLCGLRASEVADNGSIAKLVALHLIKQVEDGTNDASSSATQRTKDMTQTKALAYLRGKSKADADAALKGETREKVLAAAKDLT